MKSFNYEPLDFARTMVYSSAKCFKTRVAAGMSPRQSVAFFTPIVLSYGRGGIGIQDPQGEYYSPVPLQVLNTRAHQSASKLIGGLKNLSGEKTMLKSTSTSVPVVFNFDSNQIRTINHDGQIWFIAADVCSALDIGNPTMALRRLDDDEQALSSIEGLSRGNEKANIINESGLYSLILRSRKEEAKRFKKWVTSEVLPSIRKTGSYTTQPTDTITASQAEQLRTMITQKCLSMPKDKQAQFITKAWSKLKSHFGVTYRKIPQAEFTEALSLVARHVSEWELLEAQQEEPQSKEQILNDALKNGRWFISSSEGRLILTPVPDDAYVISADEFAKVLREPGEIPIKLLPGIIESAAGRLRNHYGEKFCKDKNK